MTETVIQMEKTTGELMDILRSKPDAAAFVRENADELQNKTVPELLADLLERKQLTRAAVICAAGLARTYGYQLFDGTYTPTRDKLIQLAIWLSAYGRGNAGASQSRRSCCAVPAKRA